MPASSNFQEAIREAQSSALVGPNVVNKALPYVGGGMVLTSIGVIGGLSMMATPLFMPLFWVAVIGNLVLFFVAQNVALKGNNATALPLLSVYSLITGFTLSGLVAFAGAVAGIGAVGTAALATGTAWRPGCRSMRRARTADTGSYTCDGLVPTGSCSSGLWNSATTAPWSEWNSCGSERTGGCTAITMRTPSPMRTSPRSRRTCSSWWRSTVAGSSVRGERGCSTRFPSAGSEAWCGRRTRGTATR